MPRLPVLPRSLRLAGLLGVVAVVVYFSLLDAPAPPPTEPPGPLWDKKLHFAAYGAVTLAASQASLEYRDRGWARVAVVLAFAFAFGVGIELAQWPLADRYASLGDVIANAIGTLLAGVAFVTVESTIGFDRTAPHSDES
jgi:VanZ family protein